MNQTAPRRTTVVIPVWDEYVDFLQAAVASVTRDAAGIPILVVDNASATTIPEIPGTTIARAPRRLSLGAARNFGLELVETEYVVFHDVDNVMLAGAVGFLEERMDARPAAAWVASIVDGATGRRHPFPRRFAARLARWPRAFALAHCLWSLYPTVGSTIMRVADARDAGGFGDVSSGEDWVLGVSLAFRGPIRMSERQGFVYRVAGDTLLARNRSPRALAARAQLVRERLRTDPAIPPWVRAISPAIAALHRLVLFAIRPAWLVLRGRRAA